MKHILGVFTEVNYCVHMHNEEQVRHVMQCNETHLRPFLFIAQRLVIRAYNEEQVKYLMQCNETHLRCFHRHLMVNGKW